MKQVGSFSEFRRLAEFKRSIYSKARDVLPDQKLSTKSRNPEAHTPFGVSLAVGKIAWSFRIDLELRLQFWGL